MKQIGVIRRLDPLNRIVIPIDYRKRMQIDKGHPMEIILTKNLEIIIRRHDFCTEQISDILNVFVLNSYQAAAVTDIDGQVRFVTNIFDYKISEVITPPLSIEKLKANFCYCHDKVLKDIHGIIQGNIYVFSNRTIDNIKQIDYMAAMISKKIYIEE